MKKQQLMKCMAASCLAVALMTAPVFAQSSDVPAANPSVAASQPAASAANQNGTTQSHAENALVTGKVTSVKVDGDMYSIQIGNEKDSYSIVFQAKKGVFVIDQQKPTEMLSLKDIKEGMTITAVMDKNAPTTLSLPPITNGARGFILNSDKGFADLSIYNDDLVNESNTLKLNLSDTTPIVNVNGAKMHYTAADLKGSECLVLYTTSTRSIPAQTTPQLVMIMNTAQDLKDHQANQTSNGAVKPDTAKPETEKPDAVKPEAVVYTTLRDKAEAKGYEVKWNSTDQSIQLTKGDIDVTLKIGDTKYTVGDQVLTMKDAPQLKNGTTFVSKEFLDSLS